jgi:hypothetical protein
VLERTAATLRNRRRGLCAWSGARETRADRVTGGECDEGSAGKSVVTVTRQAVATP